MWIVYKHTNLRNGKLYVGFTSKTLERRWREHLKDVRNGSEYHFHRAIRQDGLDCWRHEVLEEITSSRNDAALAEVKWIAELRANDPLSGYNMTTGGEGSAGHTYRHTEEAKDRIREALRQRPVSEETRAKISAALTGIKRSRETCQRLSKLYTGRKLSAETRQRMSEVRRGKPRRRTNEKP